MTQLNLNYTQSPYSSHAFELSVWSTAGTQIDFFNASMKTMGRANCTAGNTELTGNNWATAEKAVSVGNYCANTTYQSIFYEKEDVTLTLGDINPSSSYGTAFNGRQMPMIAAPGTNIISGINHYSAFDIDGKMKPYREDMTWQGGLYDCMSGTSMSTPVVAGTIALWLQANPMLSPTEVEEILKETCRTDDFTKAKPERFGYGKVDAKKGLELVIQREATGIKSIDNLTIRDLRFGDGTYYDLQGRRVSDNPQPGIYIKGGKKVIIK